MEIYRITQREYAEDLSGNGARLFGGRWNSEGVFALYTSSTRSLALLETLAHTPAKFLDLREYQLITIAVPDGLLSEKIDVKDLMPGWDAPDTRRFTKKLGDAFLLNGRGLILEVPSVMMPEENNYLINPLHEAMKQVKISARRKIFFDKRVAV